MSKQIRKDSGTTDVMVIMAVFIFMIVILTVAGLDYRKLKFTKYQMENGVIVSAVSCAITDQYEYVTNEGKILCDTDTEGAYAGAGGTAAGTRVAWQKANERFRNLLQSNLALLPEGEGYKTAKKSGVTNIRIEELRCVNVEGTTVYTYAGSGEPEVYEHGLGHWMLPNERVVKQPGFYVCVSYDVEALGQTHHGIVTEYIEIEEW